MRRHCPCGPRKEDVCKAVFGQEKSEGKGRWNKDLMCGQDHEDLGNLPAHLVSLSRLLALMLRHPRLLMRVDSHTGVGAPPRIAPQHSISRACVVAQYLGRKGVPASRHFVDAF